MNVFDETCNKLVLGGFVAALIGHFGTDVRFVNIVAALIAASIAGAIWAYWPAVLVKMGVSEV